MASDDKKTCGTLEGVRELQVCSAASSYGVALPYRGESWTAGVCLPTADAKLLLRHLFLLLARLTAGESAGWSEDDGRRVATSGGGPAKFLDMVLVQDEGPAPQFVSNNFLL